MIASILYMLLSVINWSLLSFLTFSVQKHTKERHGYTTQASKVGTDHHSHAQRYYDKVSELVCCSLVYVLVPLSSGLGRGLFEQLLNAFRKQQVEEVKWNEVG